MVDLLERVSVLSHWLNDERHRRIALISLLIIAFILRLMVALVLPLDFRVEGSDTPEYLAGARNMLELGVFGEQEGIPYAQIPPGYPLFIAGVIALSQESLMAVRVAQVALSTFITWLVYIMSQEAGGKKVGLLAMLIFALYPVWIIWPSRVLTETLYTTLALTFVWSFIRSLRTLSVWHTILTGVAFGLALLTREILFAFPLFFPLCLWWSRIPWQKAWRYLLVLVVIILLTLSPWLARNYRTFGYAFYTERIEAVRYKLTGHGYLSPRYEHLVGDNSSSEAQEPLSETAKRDIERFGKQSQWFSVSFLLNHPVTYFHHLFNRFVEYWLHPNGLHSLPDNFAVRAIYVAAHIGMLALAMVGVIIGLKRHEVASGVFVLSLINITITNLFFSGPNPRYNLPFLPILFIFTARGALAMLKRFTSSASVRS